jgi:transcriptional regulator with XRE-family HTH domain
VSGRCAHTLPLRPDANPERTTEFSVRLRKLRVERLLTQEELARRSRVCRATIRRLESRRAPIPRFSTVRQLATALGVRAAELVPDPSTLWMSAHDG